MSLEVNIEKNFGAFHLKAHFLTEGSVTGILGASGSGKSMTLKCIAGIETPDSGSIVLNGKTLFDSEKHINLPPQKRQVGYLFQNYALFPNMTVKKNILCGLHAVKDRSEREALLKEALRRFQLEDVSDHKPSEISGGQAQRTALARILVSAPKLLMLDEPFSALDSHLRLRLQLELKETLSSYKGPVLMVTHSRDEAYRMCGSITITDNGVFSPVRETKPLFADPGSFSAAAITGCKNIAAAVKTGEYEVEVPEWNVRFRTARKVRDGLKGVAFRAHYLNTRTNENRFPVLFESELEEPFEWVLLFRYEGQSPESSPIWWRLPKDKRPQVFPKELGIAPANILLLYE
ncbi:MAG: ATP-binding cassette domain-containing protein [Lachnospiraceae bacterium]|nr:ATP-binding cassette domain-containing protein [Lachnospiraceae bacterium]